MADVPCPICGELDGAWAMRKHGWPDATVDLPSQAGALVTLAGYTSSRGEELRQCTACGAYFHWRLDYTFLAGGSEDEETLTRITDAEAAALRARLPPA